MDKKQSGSSKGGCGGGNARRSASAGGGSGKLHRKGNHHGGGGGKRREIKVVYISNPMRVTTSEEGFRALVQELTGRHADPSKYRAAAIDCGGGVDERSSGGSPTEAEILQGGAPMAQSPGSTVESSSTLTADHAAGGGGHGDTTAACGGGDDENYSFAAELIDSRYSVCFSPPTFLYGGAHSYEDYDA